MENYFDGESSICPICGGKIIHPHFGELSDADIYENENSCHWIEVVDEGRSTIGYTPNCIGSQKRMSDSSEELVDCTLVDLAVQAQELKFLLKLKELQSCIHRNIDKIDKNVILEMLDIIG